MVATLTSADFSRDFSQQIISQQPALGEGLQISQLDFVRLKTNGSGDSGAHLLDRDVMGSAFEIFTDEHLENKTLLLWMGNATPAIEAALAKALAAPGVSMEEQEITVTPGPILIFPTYAKARFNIHAQVPPVANIYADPDGSLYRNRSMAYSKVINSLSVSEDFQSLLVEELVSSGVPALPGMTFVKRIESAVAVEDETVEASLPLAIILAVAMSAVFTPCLVFLLAKRRAIIRSCAKKCGMGCKKPLIQEMDEDDCTVKPFDEKQVRVCMCGKTLSLDIDSCPTCRSRNKSQVTEVNITVNVHSNTDAFGQLKRALDGFNEPRGHEGKGDPSGMKVTTKFNQIFKSVQRNGGDNSPNGDLPDLVDEYIYRRKQDYTDRPRAAGAMKTHLDGDEHDTGALGASSSKKSLALSRCKPSPASTRPTECPEGASLDSISSDSPQRSDSSPQRCRPMTRRTSPGRGSTGKGMFSEKEKEMEVIDVSDTESENSHTGLKRTGSKAVRLPKGFECRMTLDSRSLPNFTSSRLFRRTMASYAVAEEGSLPSDRINNLPQQRSRPVQSHSSQSSDANRKASGCDSIEVMDVTDFDDNC
jgi:hypothetical protein